MKTNLDRICADACENLTEGELLLLLVGIRAWLLQTTSDPEVKEALGGDD